jgi:hypothetical protein
MPWPQTREAALRYARWLLWGTRVGLALLVAGFLVYAAGLVAPHVPIERMPALWSGPAAEYLKATGIDPGWGWARLLPRGEMLPLAAIAFLASCSIACLAAAMPVFFRGGERALALICLLEILVLVLAASGLLVSH